MATSELAHVLQTRKVTGVNTLLSAGIITRITSTGDWEILLLRRRKDIFLGGFEDLPGGKLKPGETLLTALCREVWEETGRRVTAVLGLVGEFDYTEGGRSLRQFTFVIEVDEGPIVLSNEEHESFRWLTGADAVQADVSYETAHIIKNWLDRFYGS